MSNLWDRMLDEASMFELVEDAKQPEEVVSKDKSLQTRLKDRLRGDKQ